MNLFNMENNRIKNMSSNALKKFMLKQRMIEEFESTVGEEVKRRIPILMDAHLTIAVNVLWDKFDFTEEQIKEFIKRTSELEEAIIYSDVTPKEMKQVLQEEIGCKIFLKGTEFSEILKEEYGEELYNQFASEENIKEHEENK